MVGILASLLVTGPALAWSPRGEAPTVVADQTNYTKSGSPFLGYASPWCKTGAGLNGNNLVQGVNYADFISIHPSSFPSNTLITTSWPNVAPTSWVGSLGTPLTCGVWGYMFLAYGNYDGGSGQVAVTSRQVSNITTLTEEFNFSLGGTVLDFSVLNEFYLTTTAGSPNAKEIEIGLFPHPGTATLAYVKNDQTQLGTYTDPQGRAWRAAYEGQFHTFTLLSEGDLLVATVDLKGFILYLQGLGRVNPSWWFNGLAIGVEPTKNSGAMTLNRWTVVYN